MEKIYSSKYIKYVPNPLSYKTVKSVALEYEDKHNKKRTRSLQVSHDKEVGCHKIFFKHKSLD